jgi:hypothetical protein
MIRSFSIDSYCTVRVKVAFATLLVDTASVPDTVKVYVPGAAPDVVDVVELLLEPPQALRTQSTETASSITIQRAIDRRRRPNSSIPAPLNTASEVPAFPRNPELPPGRVNDADVPAGGAVVHALPV